MPVSAAVLALVLLLGLPAPAAFATVVTTIMTDPLTGIAIDGFDPVSYFTEEQPLEGFSSYEYVWGGVPWYFASAANRDIFKRSPEVYAPQFGGYGAMSLARGYLSDGNPRIYLIFKQRLYFFYSSGNREAFMMSPEKALADASANWENLAADLSIR